jgi:hypothetical protein
MINKLKFTEFVNKVYNFIIEIIKTSKITDYAIVNSAIVEC